MFRKLMALAILGSVPVIGAGIVQVASTTIAAAATTSCTGTNVEPQVVTFSGSGPQAGLSDLGYASTSKKAKTKAGAGSISCLVKGKPKTGTLDAITIKTKSTTTCTSDATPPTPCPAGDYVQGSVAGFSSDASTLYKDIPSESWNVGATDYTAVFTSSATATTCTSPEQGFNLDGHLTAPAADSGKAVAIVACLGTDTGPNTTGSFGNDVISEAGGNTTIYIVTATLDPADSTLSFA